MRKNATWLIFVHAPNSKDFKYATKAVERMQKNFQKSGNNVDAYVIFFGPTVNSIARLFYVDFHKVHVIEEVKNNGIDDVVGNIAYFVNIIKKENIDIDAVCMWCHGAGGAGLGPWKRWIRPFLPYVDAVNLLVKPFNVSLVCFDACYQGSMSSLYELPDNVKVVIASPAHHPFASILWCESFALLQKRMNKKKTLEFAMKINCEWNVFAKPKWKCLLVFDMAVIPEIAKLVKIYCNNLVFDKKSQCDGQDANLHDLYTASRNIPILQTVIEKATVAGACGKQCNKQINGMSTEAAFCRKWVKPFIRTKWYKEIVKNQKGFDNERLARLKKKKAFDAI